MKDFFKLNQPELTPGKVVRAFRRNFGFTLAEIAKLTDIQESNLSAMENDARGIGPDTALRLAAVYGLDPGTILFPMGLDILKRPDLQQIQSAAIMMRKRAAGGR